MPIGGNDHHPNLCVIEPLPLEKEACVLADFMECFTRSLVASLDLDSNDVIELVARNDVNSSTCSQGVGNRVLRPDQAQAVLKDVQVNSQEVANLVL